MAYVSMADLQEKRNQMMADRRQKAHNRFMQGRQNFMESNPNAVSNFEKQAVLGRAQKMEDEDRLRQHELKMLKQKGEDELSVEMAKARGMIGQGSEAAKANAEAAKYGADAVKEAELKKAEVQAAIGKAQNGFFDENGEYHAGSSVAQAKAQGEAAIKQAEIKAVADKYAADAQVDVQEKKNEGLAQQNQMERDLETFKHEHAKELTELKIKGMQPNRQEMVFIYNEMNKPENKGKTPGELLAEYRARVAGGV